MMQPAYALDDEDEPDDGVTLRAAASALERGDIEDARTELRQCGETKLGTALSEESLSLLDAGLTHEARARIGLFLSPKWSTEAACRAAYASAMKPRRKGARA